MNELLFLIFFPIMMSLLFYILKLHKGYLIFFVQITQIFLAILLFLKVQPTKDPLILIIGEWMIGKGVSVALDPLNVSLILLSVGLFTFFVVYDYKKMVQQPIYMFFIFTIEGLIIALFVAHDLFNFFVLMEVSTLLITVLIVYKKRAISYYDGLIYLLTNIVGMSFFLLGVAYIYRLYGFFDMSLLKEAVANSASSSSLLLAYSLLLTGISFKIGVIPVFTWLPRAHGSESAPSIVSAILSSIYINLGLIYYIKLSVIFDPIYNVKPLFLWFGFATALVGGLLAFIQKDIKKLLGYSTVSGVGFCMIGLNLSTVDFYGSIYYLFSHSMSKALLFLIAGILIKHYGTRDLYKIRGVFKELPVVGISLIFGLLALSGFPFFNGSIGKYLIGKSQSTPLMNALFYLSSFITILYLIKLSMVLFGSKKTSRKVEHSQQIVIMGLALLCLLTGLFSPMIFNYLFAYTLYIDTFLYSLKSLIYCLMLLVAFYLYKKKLRRFSYNENLNEVDLPFNFLASMIFVLFGVIAIYLYIA